MSLEKDKLELDVKIGINKKEEDKVKGYATVTVNNLINLSSMKIIEGENGLFVGFPNYKNSKGEYSKIYSINDKDVYNQINDKVINEYNKLSKENGIEVNKQEELERD